MSAENANSQRSGVHLAIDVGEARVGLAASDPDALIATPVITLRRDHKKVSDQRMIVKIARDRRARTVYVGLPLSLSGRDTVSTENARAYAQALADRLRESQDASVRLIDERFSTVSASHKLRDAGLETAQHGDSIDQAAAVEILQHALQMRASLGSETGLLVEPSRRSTL